MRRLLDIDDHKGFVTLCTMDEIVVIVHDRTDHSKRSLSVPFHLSDTVRSLQERVSEKTGIARQQLKVVLCGRTLEESTFVRDLLLGPATSLVVFVEKELPSPCICKDIQARGKLRVYCRRCSSSAVLVKTEPSNWRDVTRSSQIEVDCADCKSVQHAVFRFKCVTCNEVGAVLSHIRGNWEHVPCSCFVECLDVALKEAQFVFRPPFGYTITCPYPGCNRCVVDVHHFRVLGEEKYEKYQKIAAEKLVAMDDQGVFCPYPDCSASFFWEIDSDDGKTSCPECLRLFCRLCKSIDCVCGVDDPTTTTIEATTKKCPRCAANTERSGGCAHIHCIVCKMDWCFVCVAPWTEDCQWNHWFS
ncbi:hypothetical protein RB195_010947 [Necator americanus]|uniref:E3 ubiquitin-protein ligase parkin n=1 Tax=Necator americanus TaxID=51031 RepID=A0ABR1D080_NECAM